MCIQKSWKLYAHIYLISQNRMTLFLITHIQMYSRTQFFLCISQFVYKLGSEHKINHSTTPLEQMGLRDLLKDPAVAVYRSLEPSIL